MWNIIKPTEIKNTIWDKVDDLKVELDKEFLEREFARKTLISPSKKDLIKVKLLF